MGRKGENFYVLDCIREQMTFTKSIFQFELLSRRWPDGYIKLVENKANGPALENVLKSKVMGIKLVEPEGSKIARATACEPTLMTGNVYLPRHAPWVEEFMKECASFPRGKNDEDCFEMNPS